LKPYRRRLKMSEEKRFNHKGAASYLGIADQTLYNWRNQRRGPDYIRMGSKILYLKNDLDKFIESNKIKLNA
jgi:predicted DNA-binding transcriptional regulator AlpA